MVEFGDIQLAAVFDQDYGQNYDNYLDQETYERLSELFSIIGERGYTAEYPRGDHNLKGALETLNRQILEKRNKKDRSSKYKLAAARLASSMLREALNGYSNRADRMLDVAASVWGTTPFKFGRKSLPPVVKRSQLFDMSLDISEATKFLEKAKKIGIMPKTFKKDLGDIIFKDSALMAAKQAVSDILIDIYINKNQEVDDENDDENRQIYVGINYLVDCVKLLSSLKEMIIRKLKDLNTTGIGIKVSIKFSQPLTFYLNDLLVQVEGLIEHIDSFVKSPTKWFLSSIYSQISHMINENRVKGVGMINNVSSLIDRKFLRSQWRDGKVLFEDNIDFDKNIFGDINYFLNKVVVKINIVLNIPFEKISDLIHSTHKTRNPYYSSEMSYGRKGKIDFPYRRTSKSSSVIYQTVNYNAAGEASTTETHSTKLMNSKITKDKDILEVLYSITDNLSLAFNKEDLKMYDIDRIRNAIGDAVFNRAGLETEVSNFIETEVRKTWDTAIKDDLDDSMQGYHGAMGRFS
jgi:hypothetical protein